MKCMWWIYCNDNLIGWCVTSFAKSRKQQWFGSWWWLMEGGMGFLFLYCFVFFVGHEFPKVFINDTGKQTCVSKHAHVSKKESYNIFHVMPWNILSIFVCHMEIIKWCEIFCHITFMGHYKINNGLLTLKGLAKKVVKNSIVWAFESKQKLKDAFYHPSCNQCSKCLMLLDNNYNIFKNVEIGGNFILEKYLMKIKVSKYIKYLTNMCWNGQSIIHKYTSFYNDWKVTKWKKKLLGFTRI